MTSPLTETENTEATVSKDFTSYLSGIVEGTDMHIKLDSGATISFISEDTKMAMFSLAKRPIKKKFIMSQAVTGQSLDTIGMIDITFKLGSQTLQREVQVIRNVTQGFILGLDFLTPHGVILDMGRRLCYLGDDVLPLRRKSELAPAS